MRRRRNVTSSVKTEPVRKKQGLGRGVGGGGRGGGSQHDVLGDARAQDRTQTSRARKERRWPITVGTRSMYCLKDLLFYAYLICGFGWLLYTLLKTVPVMFRINQKQTDTKLIGERERERERERVSCVYMCAYERACVPARLIM